MEPMTVAGDCGHSSSAEGILPDEEDGHCVWGRNRKYSRRWFSVSVTGSHWKCSASLQTLRTYSFLLGGVRQNSEKRADCSDFS